MDAVEQRLARLERDNRRLRVIGLVALSAVAAVFAMGQARPARDVRAETFIVTDKTGNTVAMLGAFYDTPESSRGEAMLMFLQGEDTDRGRPAPVVPRAGGGNPELWLRGSAADGGRVRVGVGGAEGPSISLLDGEGRVRGLLGLGSPGSVPMIALFDEDEKSIWLAP
jgi:hypothetical protein